MNSMKLHVSCVPRRLFGRLSLVASGVLASAIALAQPAAAQSFDTPLLESPLPMTINDGRFVEVLSRPRPEYEAQGIRLDQFLVLPKLQTGVMATDNVFGWKNGKVGDAIIFFDPSVTATHEWDKGSVNASAGGNFQRYVNHAIRNESGYFFNLDGSVQASSNLSISGKLDHRRAYQPQYQSDSPTNALSSISYYSTSGLLRGEYVDGNVKISSAVDFVNEVYDDLTLASGQVSSNKYRDHIDYRFSTRMEYNFSGDVTGFSEFNIRKTSYHNDFISPGVPNRNSFDYRIVGGVVTNILPVARAWIGIGYMKRDFDSSLYPTMSGFTYDSKLLLVPSGLSTVLLQAKRAIVPSITTGSGYFSDIFQVRADHELLRNLLLYAQVGHETNRFRGLERTDRLWRNELGSTYYVNSNVIVSSAVDYLDRGSDNPQSQIFKEWRGTIAVTLAY